jgi:N-acetyl-anhydromuramyl-L-alanine amidase AmpD
VQLITNGFTRGSDSRAVFGVDRKVTAVGYHSTEGDNIQAAIDHWNGGAGGAHFIIAKNGEVVLTCQLEDVAWHAGTDNDPRGGTYGRTQFWRFHNINPYSVGIELLGFADARDGGFTPQQVASLRRVTDWLVDRYGILRKHTMDQIEGLHLHAELSTSRSDPGPTFQWAWVE